jgi:hypothetical protein
MNSGIRWPACLVLFLGFISKSGEYEEEEGEEGLIEGKCVCFLCFGLVGYWNVFGWKAWMGWRLCDDAWGGEEGEGGEWVRRGTWVARGLWVREKT